MGARILDVITSCKACPHRQYYTSGIYECRKAMQRLIDVVPIPDWCPLAAYPVQSTAAKPEQANSSNSSKGSDAARLNWLATMVVNVRVPLRYGSRDLFWASPEDLGDRSNPSDIRAQIDAARAQRAAAQGEE